MSRDDYIYGIILLLGVGFGHFYRKITDSSIRKNVGTLYGILIVFSTSSLQSLHVFSSFLTSVIIIKVVKGNNHLIVFFFMMVYLFLFRIVHLFGLPMPGGHTNMIQMILTLKIIGFAFEKSSILNKIKEAAKNGEKILLSDVELEICDSSVLNIFHYCFNYLGLLTGPYYNYKTFYDYFHLPFYKKVNVWDATYEKLKWVPIYVFLFIIASYIWPLEYATSDEFYESRSFFYRLFYVWPTFFIFRMRIYSGIILAECVCISAGFGAYPIELNPKCGHGPSINVTKDIIDRSEKCELKYNFETIDSVNVENVEKCWTFRDGMKHWNKCIQYWLAMNVYKRFPNKKYRIIATMAVSAYWHGVHAGYYFCILGPIFYLPIEDLYVKLLKSRNPQKQQVYNIIIWILKFFAFSYMGIAFLLKDIQKIWYYYSSIYHFGYIFWIVLYLVCLLLWRQNKRIIESKEANQDESEKKSN